MKITSVIARYLLGFIFLVFGLNGFLHFIPAEMPTGTAGQFIGALFVSNSLAPHIPTVSSDPRRRNRSVGAAVLI